MPSSNHFDHRRYQEFNILEHRPHKTFQHWFRAILATALFRIWPTLLFFCAWSTMVVLVNLKTDAKMEFPNAMITVLGVLLGLTLSYRTSSAYDKYQEGRRMWSQIVIASRNWARIVWIHCPDTTTATPFTDPADAARDEVQALLEKKTIVQLSLAFAVAVKHYLRHEPGIMYEDLFHLVNFIPNLHYPSGLAAEYASIAPGLPMLSAGPIPPRAKRNDTSDSTGSTATQLLPAENAPQFRLFDIWPSKGRKQRELATTPLTEEEENDVPLKILTFMSAWVAAQQRRKIMEVPTLTQLYLILSQMTDALASLERILTTPIPWSYNAHIWEMSWIYCLALPFQLWSSKMGWVTVPATVITAYFVMGYASIAEEIENPFGFDKNDLNLGYFCQEIIAKELEAVTSRPYRKPEEWIFTPANQVFGPNMPTADELLNASPDVVRAMLRKNKDAWYSDSKGTSTPSVSKA